MAPTAIYDTVFGKAGPAADLAPPKLYSVKEVKFEKPAPVQADGREKALQQPDGSAAIVIDNGAHASPLAPASIPLCAHPSTNHICPPHPPGSSSIRAGWSFEAAPRLAVPPIMAKYRDRKLGKTFSLAGYDCYADTTARSHQRHAFEAGTGVVANWDVMEHVLDYCFLKLGMNGAEGNIDLPVVMTEAVANLPYSRKCECRPGD